MMLSAQIRRSTNTVLRRTRRKTHAVLHELCRAAGSQRFRVANPQTAATSQNVSPHSFKSQGDAIRNSQRPREQQFAEQERGLTMCSMQMEISPSL